MSKVMETIKTKAALLGKTIVLPEGEDSRVVEAAASAVKEGVAKVVLLGNPEEISASTVTGKTSIPNVPKLLTLANKTLTSDFLIKTLNQIYASFSSNLLYFYKRLLYNIIE